MDLVQVFFDIFHAIIALLNGLLSLLEQLFGPLFDLIDRWNNLFG